MVRLDAQVYIIFMFDGGECDSVVIIMDEKGRILASVNYGVRKYDDFDSETS